MWHFRGQQDVYSRKKEWPGDAHVDHVVEVQVLNTAMDQLGNPGETVADRVKIQHIKKAVNGHANLNVTSRDINQSKKGPFTTFVRQFRASQVYGATLDDIAREKKNQNLRRMIDEGIWDNIVVQVAESAAAIHDDLISQGGIVRTYAESLHTVIDGMDIW